MTNVIGQTGKLRRAGILAGWARTVSVWFSGANQQRGVNRTKFEQLARNLNLQPPELYWLLTGRRVSADALNECLAAELEASPQFAKRLRAIERQHRAAVRMSVPIAPCC